MSKAKQLISAVLVAILIAPVAVYISKFGFHITSDHARWTELGSAMAGIYAPTLSALTLLVLANQVFLQRQINAHHFDQALISESRSDINLILARLDDVLLREEFSGMTLKKVITDEYRRVSTVDEIVEAKADDLNEHYPQIFELWSAFYPILAGLKAVESYPYHHNYVSALQKITYVLSYRTCTALDNYHRAVCRERLNYDYQFTAGQFG
ncbi:hypothetical protein SAMN04487869_1136 [Marinobacter sp. DSM 26671]|uniref:hypothetical protein n=1 Tax=Marinobacter sp. DSM 26671 TaxID=1761793 RepID=UPI0008E71EAC|nr:hypothetical protein [Marinobacter sp. DSM 26671]SFE66220.1 hypothetical protein SAMN04487869_1136 [Marinobacter sp. DSM 26671]